MEQFTRAQLLVVAAEQSALIVALTERIEGQAARIEVLVGQVAELTAKAGRNSQNSSMPPSSDRFVKPARPVRGRSGRQPGKQPGAPGAGLEFTDSPDEIVDHQPVACAGCGSDLADAEPVGMSARQVRDVPLVRVMVTEHRMHRRAAPAGRSPSHRHRPRWTGRSCTGRTCGRSRCIWWCSSTSRSNGQRY